MVSIGSTEDGKFGSLREETGNALESLAANFTKPIAVGLSGGHDSQAVCLSMMDRKIPFTPLIIRLLNLNGEPGNLHDIEGAFQFCKKWNLTPIVEDMNVHEFFQTQARDFAKANHLSGGRTIIQLWLVEKYKKTHAFIMAGGDPVISRNTLLQTTNNEELITGFTPTPIQQHLIANQIEGCTKFFMYSPELIAAYLDHPTVRGFLAGFRGIYESVKRFNSQDHDHTFTHFVKPLMYAEQWPELIHRRKYHGFEGDAAFDEVSMDAMNFGYRGNKQVVVTIKELRDHLIHGNGHERVWTSDTPYFKPSDYTKSWLRQTLFAN